VSMAAPAATATRPHPIELCRRRGGVVLAAAIAPDAAAAAAAFAAGQAAVQVRVDEGLRQHLGAVGAPHMPTGQLLTCKHGLSILSNAGHYSSGTSKGYQQHASSWTAMAEPEPADHRGTHVLGAALAPTRLRAPPLPRRRCCRGPVRPGTRDRCPRRCPALALDENERSAQRSQVNNHWVRCTWLVQCYFAVETSEADLTMEEHARCGLRSACEVAHLRHCQRPRVHCPQAACLALRQSWRWHQGQAGARRQPLCWSTAAAAGRAAAPLATASVGARPTAS
jgi:hypothetical protein